MEKKNDVMITEKAEPNNKKQNRKWIIIGVAVLLVTNLLTFFLTGKGIIHLPNSMVISNNDQTVLNALDKINNLEKIIQAQYYEDVSSEELMNGALHGLFDGIGDIYSYYYTQEEYENELMQTSGSFEGVGILVTEDESRNAIVVTPYKDTPAGNAGIQIGDVIAAVDGEDMHGKGVNYAVSKIRGPKDTEVKITIERNGETIEMTLKRDTINVQSVESKSIGNNTGYISISEFIETTGDDFCKALDELETKGIQSLVIDLRFNGGGLVDQAVAVADRLMDEGLVVSLVDKNGHTQEFKTTSDKKFDKPIVVLVNAGSASASEILSGALQDRKAATLVGTKTFGKGIVQSVEGLPDGSGYQITIAKYLTPNGTAIHEIGLTPDVVIEQDEAYQNQLEVPEEADVQLQKAVEILGQ